MAIISRILLLAAAVPFVLATGSKSCKSNEFYFSQRDCCVSRGPPPSPPAPPKNTQCPTNGWSWNAGQGCCTPHAPPEQQAPPACNGGWSWDKSGLTCNPIPPRGYPPQSSAPSKPTTPATPQKPTTPSYPTKPSSPAVPEKPTTPATPQKPTTPATPSKPTTPATPSTPSTPGNCESGHFYFGQKDCCLPHGGPPAPPSPPSGNQCPPSGWSWHTGKGCCVPNHPPSQMPPPQCPKGWDWNTNDLKCYPTPPTTTPPPSKPSNTPGKPGHYKRHSKSRSVNLCPSGLQACALKGLTGLTGDYECVDTATELTSCGGCASIGAGQDCTAIEGAWNVGCDQGACKVYTCAQGFRLSLDGKSCAKL